MRRIACISLLLMTAVGCNRATSVGFGETPQQTRISIAGLKSLCEGASHRISGDASIRGYVVANDLNGEFYHRIVLQDDSGGISIAIDGDELHWTFAIGTCVEVRCNGLTLRDYGGKIELCAAPDDLGEMEIPNELTDRFMRVVPGEEMLPHARRLSFDEVQSRHIDTRVRFDRVHFADAPFQKCWCDIDPETGEFLSTVREIIDQAGNRFQVRTLWFCKYADEPLPEGEGSLVGVIDYFGGEYSLRITSHEILFP